MTRRVSGSLKEWSRYRDGRDPLSDAVAIRHVADRPHVSGLGLQSPQVLTLTSEKWFY